MPAGLVIVIHGEVLVDRSPAGKASRVSSLSLPRADGRAVDRSPIEGRVLADDVTRVGAPFPLDGGAKFLGAVICGTPPFAGADVDCCAGGRDEAGT